MKKYFFLLFIILGILLLGGCKKKLTEEYYVDIPAPGSISEYDVSINSENVGDTIVANYPCLKYDIDYPDNCSAKAEIRHNFKTDTINIRHSGYIPVPNDDDRMQLKILIYDKSEDQGAGSISGRSGIAVDSLEWPIIVDMKPTKLDINLNAMSDKEYKLSWSEPVEYYGKPSYYEIRQYNEENKIVATEAFAILKELTPNSYFSVKAFYDYEYLNTWEGGFLFSMQTRIITEEISNDQILLSWEPIYNSVYTVQIGDSLQISYIVDTSILIKTPPFGIQEGIMVTAKFGALQETTYGSFRREKDLKQSATNLFLLNPENDELYSAATNNLYCYQLPDFNIVGQNTGTFSDFSSICYVASKSKFIGVAGNLCEVFTKKSLTREKTINLASVANHTKVTLSSDNIIHILSLYSDKLSCETYGLVNGEFISSFPLEEPRDKLNTDMDISINGKYIYVYDHVYQQFSYYVKSSSGYEIIRSEEIPYESLSFNPNNEEELFVQKEGIVEVLNCSDLSSKREIQVVEGKMCNIDPKSNNMLFDAETKLIITNASGTILLEIDFKKSSSLYKAQLLGNAILYENYALDISKYL
ncbi:MAG: hypothetical protein LBH92_08345 [Bacteroidales bacterium]|jgi:hypothetical protein|nr:hypothetical protein [Bacteroidales bacterium]